MFFISLAFILHFTRFALSLPQKYVKMIETFLVAVLIIAIAMSLLCIKLILRKDGKFSSQHVDDNPGLRKRKIRCVMEQDREARRKVFGG